MCHYLIDLSRFSPSLHSPLIFSLHSYHYFYFHSGYLESCRSIVNCARTIARTIKTSIPELYILGSPPASVVAFGSKHPSVNVLEVGDAMAVRGWHLNALSGPPAVHIACTVSGSFFIIRIFTDFSLAHTNFLFNMLYYHHESD